MLNWKMKKHADIKSVNNRLKLGSILEGLKEYSAGLKEFNAGLQDVRVM